MEITFDQSSAEFMVEAMGLSIVEGKITNKGKPKLCCFCNSPVTLDTLAGFIRGGRIVCEEPPCLFSLIDEMEQV